MNIGFRIILIGTLLLTFAAAAFAQTSAEQTARDLRAQLSDIEAKQSVLAERAQKLDEDLKPENIERSLALTGSTKPEELREQRRRQLEKEKEGVRAQLDQLAASRTRLEAAIAAAEAESYRRSALAGTTTSPATTNIVTPQPARAVEQQQQQQKPKRRRVRRHRPRQRRT
jgi:cell division protein FtsB